MNTALRDLLAEQRRDALSAYVIHHVLPDKVQVSGLNMLTTDHLDRYLMLDTQVTSAVTTSCIAEALACVQTYINSIFNSIEPGYDKPFDKALVSFWQQAMSNYSVWAAYQMLEDYPENYIRADLRLDKTQLFQSLENNLGQGKLNDVAVQHALLGYLKGYEQQNCIRVQSGYIDTPCVEQDRGAYEEYAYTHSDYYLLGHDTASPAQYYWRKIVIRLDNDATFIAPDALSEWLTINLPAGNTLIEARLVLFCGRLHLVWLSHDEPIEQDFDSDELHYPLKLQMVYLGLDEQWSTPELLWSAREKGSKAKPLDVTRYRLLALAITGPRGSDDQLLIAVGEHANGTYSTTFATLRDVLKRSYVEALSNNQEAIVRLFKSFENASSRVNFQMRLASSELTLNVITAASGNDPYLMLEALLEESSAPTQGKSTYRLHLRGLVGQTVGAAFPLYIQLKRFQFAREDGSFIQAEVRSNHYGAIEFRAWVNTPNGDVTLKLLHYADPDFTETLAKGDFSPQGNGYFVATKVLNLTKLIPLLNAYRAQEIHDGAGFSITIDGGEALPLAHAGNYIILLFGFGSPRPLELTVANTTASWKGNLMFTGAAVTPWVTHDFQADIPPETLTVSFGPPDKLSKFTLTLKAMDSDFGNVPYVARQASGTDFLVFESIQVEGKPLTARLNSQHVADLINRVQVSPEAVFDWDAQHLREPAYVTQALAGGYRGWQRSEDDPLMNLYDANGLYLRELFFHVPHLIASRLQEEERFEEARHWLGMIFSPHHKLSASQYPSVDYWRCGWILRDDTEASGLEHQLIDPHVIALHAPSHYRKAIFIQYVRLMIGEADLLYRRQTRDSLANAWLLYRMAAELMGEAPDARAIDTWQTRTVGDLISTGKSRKLLLRHADEILPEKLPKQLSTFLWVGVAAHPDFRLPVNEQLLDIWRLLDDRFYNLRHFLTMDGAPLQMPLYAPALNPLDLLMARMGGSANLSHLLGYHTMVPPFRFRTVVAKAQEVVSALIQFGEQLRGYMELEDRTELESMQYQQAAELASYTIGIQEQLYQQQRKNQDGLEEQRSSVKLRQAHYSRLYEEHISLGEYTALSLHRAGRSLSSLASGTISAAHFASVAPNIFGMATGGGKMEGPLKGVGFALDVGGSALVTAAELLQETEGYRRRREEWQLQAKLAGKELQVLDKQLQAQHHATLAAECSLQHTRKVLEQTQRVYAFYQNKSTNVSLYRWLRSLTATLHATLFDVAVSLCNSAEACWQFETGNYGNRIIRTPVWQADRHGLNAGSELRVDLMRLESEALLRHVRPLEVRKTISLRALLTENLVFDKQDELIESWDALGEVLNETGELQFTFSEVLFNKDYPGHYLRRLHSVALSMPALLGPYQNIRATLLQKHSQLLIKPDIEGVKYLSPELTEEDDFGDSANVRMSLRAGQQICLSSAGQDNGHFTGMDVDDRYRWFENTGAVSSWVLRFPRHAEQKDMLAGLSDIVFEVQYFALYGGARFEEEVTALLPNDKH